MSIKPQYNTENYFKHDCTASGQSIVECRFAQSDDLAEVTAVHAQVTLSDCTASSGRINYGGRLVCTVVYVDEGGKLCRVQKGVEFAHFVDGENFVPAQSCRCRLTCLKTQLRREGSSIIVSAVVNAEISVYVKAERKYLVSCDGAVCKIQKVALADYALFTGSSEVEDEFEVDGVADILIPSATPLVYGSERRAGVIEINGEVALSILAVRGNAPVNIERVVPFKAEITHDGAELSGACDLRAAVEDLSVTARVDEDRGKCEILSVISLAFDGSFCGERFENAAVDLFSRTNDLNAAFCEERLNKCTGIESLSRRVSSAVVTKAKLDFSCAFKAAALPACEYTYNADEGTLDGAVTATLIYEQSGELRSTTMTMPFSLRVENAADCDVAVCGVSVRQRAEGECEGEAVLKLVCRKIENSAVNLITSVEEGDPLPVNDSAVTVFVPQTGDDSWNVCKKLRQSENELISCNPELKFPLSGGERIIVYRRKQA